MPPKKESKKKKNVEPEPEPEPVEEKVEEKPPEVEKEPIPDYLYLTNDFRQILRQQLQALKEEKIKRDGTMTQMKSTLEKKKKEEVALKRQKFDFKKKSPFLKAIQTKGYFFPGVKTVEKHGPYCGGKELYRATCLDRVKEINKWGFTQARLDFFHEAPPSTLSLKTQQMMKDGDEKYQSLLKLEQDEYKNKNDGTFKNKLMTTKLQTLKLWKPNIIRKELFIEEKPLYDTTYTPRHRLKAISLPRNYGPNSWLPIKTDLGFFVNKKRK